VTIGEYHCMARYLGTRCSLCRFNIHHVLIETLNFEDAKKDHYWQHALPRASMMKNAAHTYHLILSPHRNHHLIQGKN